MPYLASRAFCAASETAFSARKGPPGTACITKKVTVMTIQTVKIAMATRFSMYIRVLEFIRNLPFPLSGRTPPFPLIHIEI